eukprot:4192512-Prymnesium_polylepis.1
MEPPPASQLAWIQHQPPAVARGEHQPLPGTWELATVAAFNDDGTVSVELDDGSRSVVSRWHRHDPSHDKDLEDAGQMSDLHEAALLKLLARRFAADKIYTWTGDILLSVNPYREIPGLYDDQPQRPGGWTATSG